MIWVRIESKRVGGGAQRSRTRPYSDVHRRRRCSTLLGLVFKSNSFSSLHPILSPFFRFSCLKASIVDAVVAEDKLIIAFIDEDDRVNIAMCNSQGACEAEESSNNWMQNPASPDLSYSFDLGYESIPGIIGVEYGRGLNGTSDPSNGYVYIATSANGPDDYTIRVDQFDSGFFKMKLNPYIPL